jgi:hypothetical protein
MILNLMWILTLLELKQELFESSDNDLWILDLFQFDPCWCTVHSSGSFKTDWILQEVPRNLGYLPCRTEFQDRFLENQNVVCPDTYFLS